MKFLIKKICTLIMTLFLVSVAAFLAFQIIPGDVVTSILGTEATAEREEALREELGLDRPPVERYFAWASDVLHGDFGVSYRYSKNMNEMMPVKELIGDKLPVTLYLAALSFFLIVLVSIPLGVFWAKSRSHFLDATLGVLTQGVMAIPFFPWYSGDVSVRDCPKMVCTGWVCQLSGRYEGISGVSDLSGVICCPSENCDDSPFFKKFHADRDEV